MKFRWTFLSILFYSLTHFAFAESQAVSASADDFDLPDDVAKAEVVKFIPVAPASDAATVETATVDAAIASTATADTASASASDANEDSLFTGNFAPIEAASTSDEKDVDSVQGLQNRTIPQELNRPIRVGIFVGVKELYLMFNGEEIKVTASGSNIKLQAGKKSMEMESREFQNEDGSCLAVAQDQKSLKRACYPGSILLRASNGKVDAINAVDVEDYLRGSVPYEIGKLDASRIEALKAQAIAARTYAYKHFNSREAMGFDVYADVKDQVYKGLEAATPLTDAAVKATAGVVMTHNGEFIIAYYHSTCGGKTETLATWNRPNLPYLQSKPDLRPNGSPWCNESSYMKWERKFSDKEIVDLFKKNAKEAKAKFSSGTGADFKKVKSISVIDTLTSGRILTLRVETDKGHFDVLTDKTRWLFKKAGTILPSSLFTVKHVNNEWIVTGSGFGHGVGMCQMGVRARAQAGQGFQEILTHYYPGITLEKYNR